MRNLSAFEAAIERFIRRLEEDHMRRLFEWRAEDESPELHPELEKRVRRRALFWKLRALGIGFTFFGVTFLIAWLMAVVVRRF